MKLNIHSWHVRLNDYVYGWGYSSETKSLCPYFWGTIAAIFLAIPMWISDKARQVLSKGIRNFLLRYFLPIIVIGIGVLSLLAGNGVFWIAWGTGLLLFNFVLHETKLFNNLITYIIGKRMDRVEVRPKPKMKKKHMSVEMLKAWKGKHCPMIEWE